MKRRVILEPWICKKLGIASELYCTLKQGYVASCKMQKQKETRLKTKTNNSVYNCQLLVFSGLVLTQSYLSCPPSVLRVFWQYIKVDLHVLTQWFSLFLSFPPHNFFTLIFCPFLPPFGANHNGTSLPFRMWAGIQSAVSRADSKVVL